MLEFSMTFDQIDLMKEAEKRGEEPSGFSITRNGRTIQLTNNELIDAMLACVQQLSDSAVSAYSEAMEEDLPSIVRKTIVRDFVNRVVESIPLQISTMAEEIFADDNDDIPDPSELMGRSH